MDNLFEFTMDLWVPYLDYESLRIMERVCRCGRDTVRAHLNHLYRSLAFKHHQLMLVPVAKLLRPGGVASPAKLPQREPLELLYHLNDNQSLTPQSALRVLKNYEERIVDEPISAASGYGITGYTFRVWYYKDYCNGIVHRIDGPAIQHWSPTGIVTYAEWRKMDQVTCMMERDITTHVTWYYDNKLHRDGGPAVTRWHANGQLALKRWMRHGKRHREDGPALLEWNGKGELVTKRWFINEIGRASCRERV